jgi:hypothetical protein
MDGQQDSAPQGLPLPNADQTRAVLIGVSRYDELPQLGPVARNLDGLAETLSRQWKLPTANIEVVDDPAKPGDVHQAVLDAAAKATDTLLIY